jgi:hypothetical protein
MKVDRPLRWAMLTKSRLRRHYFDIAPAAAGRLRTVRSNYSYSTYSRGNRQYCLLIVVIRRLLRGRARRFPGVLPAFLQATGFFGIGLLV